MKKTIFIVLISSIITITGCATSSTFETAEATTSVSVSVENAAPQVSVSEAEYETPEILAEPVLTESYLMQRDFYEYYVLYPSKETASLIESIEAELNEKGILDDLEIMLTAKEPDINAIAALIQSAEWSDAYYLGSGTLTASYKYFDDTVSINFSTGLSDTMISIKKNNTSYTLNFDSQKFQYMSLDEAGSFTAINYDSDNNPVQTASGTLSDGIITGDIKIIKDGVTYSGHLDENGHSLEKQQVKNKVIYAVSDDETQYLYESGKASSFSLTSEYLNLAKEKPAKTSPTETTLQQFETSYLEEKQNNDDTNFNNIMTVTADALKKEAAREAAAAAKPAQTTTTVTPSASENSPVQDNTAPASVVTAPEVQNPGSNPTPEPQPQPEPDPSPTPSPGDGEDMPWSDDVL